MSEGKLFASRLPGAYSVGTPDGPDLVNGQALEILLGGHWITGRVKYSAGTLDTEETDSQRGGTYNLNYTDEDDAIVEASEESFPASDSPAWPSKDQSAQAAAGAKPAAGYYFVADADQSLCGICVGMQIRNK